ncbi:MAG: hypothetical protein ABIT01_09205, partial [Thermoanaerobaculia bacterium]
MGVTAFAETSAAQSILTVAGGGSDEGRPAAASALRVPFGVAIGPAGRLFVVDSYNHRIHVLSDFGLLESVAGNGTGSYSGDGGAAILSGLNEPEKIAFVGATIYIADTKNSLVRRVDPSGVITTVAGLASDRAPGFSGDGGPATSAKLSAPSGLAIDAAGNLFIADSLNHRIRKVAAGTGVITTIAGTGTPAFAGDGAAASQASFNEPRAICVGPGGDLYIADSGNHAVRRIAASTNVIETVAGTGSAGDGGDGGPAVAARLHSPRGVALTPDGFL